MGFRTKLDFSDNRQVKQRIETTTILSGGTYFGVPYGDLPTGPNTNLSSITQTINNLTGTFSGNSGTTIFTWADTRMSLGDSSLSAITPSNSATTQNTGAIFTPDVSSLFNIDGNTGYTHYTGVSYSMYANTFTNLGGGAYSGDITSQQLQILETIGLDFTGRTIWNDVSGITRTNRLIITENPQVGYVWTCLDSEGMGEWAFNSSASTPTIWTAGTGTASAVLGGSDGYAGAYSVAAGLGVSATTNYSFAEGFFTLADGSRSHAEGSQTQALGGSSHAEGAYTIASGSTAHSEGDSTIAGGDRSHAEGLSTQAMSENSHAEGKETITSGKHAHAEGYGSIASSEASHAEGYFTLSSGDYSHAEGANTIASGDYSHAEGQDTIASGDTSHAEGWLTVAGGQGSHAEGYLSQANGDYSHAQGLNTRATGFTSHAEGAGTLAGGTYSHAEGQGSIASGLYSHAEGNFSTASGNISHAEGAGTIASGSSAHAEGTNSIAGGDDSHAQGRNTQSIGDYSHAGGYFSKALNDYSFVHGQSSVASNTNTIVFGKNITGTTAETLYTNNLIIDNQDGLFTSKLGVNTSSPAYVIDARGGTNNKFYYDEAGAGGAGAVILSARTGLALMGVSTDTSVVNQSGSVSIGIRAWDDAVYSAYGKPGDSHIYSSKQSNGLNIISSDGTGTEDYIRFWTGGDCASPSAMAMNIVGSGATQGYIGINTLLPTERLDVNGSGRFRSIGSTASAGALHYTSDGTLTTNTSDERLKTNITTLTGALSKVNQLRGVTYNWTENPTGDTRIGFIAQEVNSIVPELTFTNPNSPEQYMGVHYDNVTALLVEAVKELSSGITTSNNTHLETQTILAEDNNVELNFNGTQQTALGGGLSILHAKGQGLSSDLITDANGDFVTNNDFKPQALTIPLYTPTSSNDAAGSEGNITRDDNYLYIKSSTGWKRTNLENF